MDDILGELNVNSAKPDGDRKRKTGSGGSIKARVYETPKRIPETKREIPSSPPVEMADVDDDFAPVDDGDVDMNEVIGQDDGEVDGGQVKKEQNGVPESSPPPADEDSDDDFAMAKLVGKDTGERVHISAVKAELPTKPTRPPQSLLAEEKVPLTSDNDGWKAMAQKLELTSEVGAPVPSSTTGAPEIKTEELVDEANKFQFFWTDYLEAGSTLILFGKTKLRQSGEYVSCAVHVRGLLRDLYFLPRAHRRGTTTEVGTMDVYDEVTELLARQGVKTFKAKPATRKYCFELRDVPREAEYLKVLLPFDAEPLPADMAGETFSRVFGTQTHMFEQFVLLRNVMGPCWLELNGGSFDDAALRGASWATVNACIDDPMDIATVPDNQAAPPFNVLSLSIRTIMNHSANRQEVVAVSGRVYRNVDHDTTTPAEDMKTVLFSAVRPIDKVFPPGFKELVAEQSGAGPKTVVAVQNETALLNYVVSQIQRHDPDVIVGHQLESLHLSIILSRCKDLNVRFWNKLGRLRSRNMPHRADVFGIRSACSGRLLCDIVNDMGRSMTPKCDSWTLSEVVSKYLPGQSRQDVDVDASKTANLDDARELLEFVRHNEMDTFFVAAVMFRIQILGLTKQLTNLAGNAWARTLTGSRVDRNEFILLHEFTRQGYIVPDKQSGADFRKAKAAAAAKEEAAGNTAAAPSKKYQGGLVFEPEKGLYKTIVLVMDFNSLYPSIIQEYNICFTTVDRSNCNSVDDPPPAVPDESVSPGIFPRLIQTLVNRRREVKKLLKDRSASDSQRAQWDIKQQALKLTANSMYGCLGFPQSRFYALPLAMLTTFKGREILSSTRELAETECDLKVVYGDTDSVMINTNVVDYKEALSIGHAFRKKVNDRYRLLEIDVDNVFQRLLLNAKKKYAALNMVEQDGQVSTQLEVKGLDLKRREYCQLSKDASLYALDRIMYEHESETALAKVYEYLRDLADKVRAGSVPLPKFIIRNKLSKNPRDYTGPLLPHVVVARRRLDRGEVVKADDVIQYVIANTGDDAQVPDRARTVAEMKKAGLAADAEWYLVHQLLPPLERVCANVDGADRARLAEVMGIDVVKHGLLNRTVDHSADKELDPLESTIPDAERFRDARRLVLTCPASHEFVFKGLVPDAADTVTASGISCPECKTPMPPLRLNAQLEVAIRTEIARYYAGWLVCDESSCRVRTRQIGVYGKKCLGRDGLCQGVMSYEYTDRALYNQLLYFDSLFDVDKAKKNAALPSTAGSDTPTLSPTAIEALAEQNRDRFAPSRAVVDSYLANCGRRFVDMNSLFSFM